MADYLKQKFSIYTAAVPREEIYVHSDRDEYIAGEEMWFNVYLIDRQSFKPSSGSRIAYFEILNPDSRPVVQKRILLMAGFGPGQIVFPDTLSTGRYTIRVYTSRMKNFLPYNCFMKDITVYNTLHSREFTGDLSSVKSALEKSDKLIPDEKTDTGVTLNINNTKTEIVEISLRADDKFRSENNNLFYIFIQTHGNINFVSSEKMTGETTVVTIPKTQLSEGVNQISIFNSRGEPVAERFIYTPVRDDLILTLHTADSFKLRNKMTIGIDLVNEFSQAFNSASLSVSVTPKTFNPENNDIKDYMVFGSEYGLLPGNVIRNRKIGRLSAEAMDSILLNIRSNWINWRTILSGDLPHIKFQTEKEDHYLLGKLIYNDKDTTHSVRNMFLCLPGKEAGFQYARTDTEGNFNFSINIDEDLKDLIIMPDDASNSHKIIIESSFSDKYIQSARTADSVKRSVPPYISDWSDNYQVRTIYGVTDNGGLLNPFYLPVDPVRFYGKPDLEIILADYISLPTMEEVFIELIPHVSLKKKKNIYEISISDRVDNSPYFASPTILVDGVIIKDASIIAGLDPITVERIDVIKGPYLIGKYFFTGIVNVITKSGDFSCIPLPDYMIRLPYRVADPVRSFLLPDYSSEEKKSSRIPDFRNTLYWNPSVKTDNKGRAEIEFWTSDVVSDYEIIIHGITQEGKLISAKKTIRVN